MKKKNKGKKKNNSYSGDEDENKFSFDKIMEEQAEKFAELNKHRVEEGIEESEESQFGIGAESKEETIEEEITKDNEEKNDKYDELLSRKGLDFIELKKERNLLKENTLHNAQTTKVVDYDEDFEVKQDIAEKEEECIVEEEEKENEDIQENENEDGNEESNLEKEEEEKEKINNNDDDIVKMFGVMNSIHPKNVKKSNLRNIPETEKIGQDIVRIKEIIDLDYHRENKGRKPLKFSNVRIIYQYPAEIDNTPSSEVKVVKQTGSKNSLKSKSKDKEKKFDRGKGRREKENGYSYESENFSFSSQEVLVTNSSDSKKGNKKNSSNDDDSPKKKKNKKK